MTSPPRTREREAERRVSLRTLVIASIASATAAIVTSRFWTAGTPLTAAITPVIVALVSEMLHRPTAVIAERLTTDRPAIRPDPDAPQPPGGDDADPVEPTVVSGGRGSGGRSRRKIAVGVVVTTAVLAFAVAAAALTLPELIGGSSLGGGHRTTLFGGKHHKSGSTGTDTSTTPTDQQTVTETAPQKTVTETTPAKPPTQTETTPKTNTQTTPTTAAPKP